MPALSLYCHERERLLKPACPQLAAQVRGYQLRRTREYVLLTISDLEGTGGRLLSDFFRQSGYDGIN